MCVCSQILNDERSNESCRRVYNQLFRLREEQEILSKGGSCWKKEWIEFLEEKGLKVEGIQDVLGLKERHDEFHARENVEITLLGCLEATDFLHERLIYEECIL